MNDPHHAEEMTLKAHHEYVFSFYNAHPSDPTDVFTLVVMTFDDHNLHFDPTIVFDAPQNAVSDFLPPVLLFLEDPPHFSLLTKASIKTSRRTSPIKPSP